MCFSRGKRGRPPPCSGWQGDGVRWRRGGTLAPSHALISIQRIRVRQKRRPRLACPKEHVEVAAHKPFACDPECHGIAATIVNARQRLAAEVGLASDVAALYRDHLLKAEITPGRAMTVFGPVDLLRSRVPLFWTYLWRCHTCRTCQTIRKSHVVHSPSARHRSAS